MNTNLDYKHPFTAWEIIKNDIELDIISGIYKTGERVPSINQISSNYEISSRTAIKVLENMHNEGTLIKQQGLGYFVTLYAKEKLLKKHKEILITKTDEVITMAQKMCLSKIEFSDMLFRELDKNWE